MGLEVTTVADDEAVLFDGAEVVHYIDLEPDTAYDHDGTPFRTLPRPSGERLATVATVNDVHFGETECGLIEGLELGQELHSAPGEPPYPITMNRGAIDELTAAGVDAVVVKGDLTSTGSDDEYGSFLELYQPAFGDRLRYIHGNHDAYAGARFGQPTPIEVTLPRVTLAIIDTVIPGKANGQVSSDQ